MLVGKTIDVAKTLRETVKDIKDGVKGAKDDIVGLFKAGQAIVSKINDFGKSIKEKVQQRQAEDLAKKKEENKKAKQDRKNQGGTQN